MTYRTAAEAIADDLEGRAAIGDEWQMIDPAIRDEIVDKWTAIIQREIEDA